MLRPEKMKGTVMKCFHEVWKSENGLGEKSNDGAKDAPVGRVS